MPDDELRALREALSAHHAIVRGAGEANSAVDVEGASQVHAGIARILERWREFSAHEQREIVRTIEYVVNTEDAEPDLLSPDGFRDDLAELRRLEAFLGYV